MPRKQPLSKKIIPPEDPEAPPLPGTDAGLPKAETEQQLPELKETPAQHNQPPTEPMEVHHHPEVEKKGFKEYLLEGLMIFFAVFMGFIAENIRESYTEHIKADTFAVNMVSDLTDDTAALKNYIAYYTYAYRNVDSLMELLSNNDVKNIPKGKLYLFGLWGGAEHPFVSNDATFQQMKSTGGLQFFEKHIAHETEQYDQLCRKLLLMQANDHPLYVEVRKLRSQIFEFKYNYIANDIIQFGYMRPVDTARLNAFTNSNPPVLTYDQSIFNQYLEMVRSRFLDRQVRAADSVLAHATKLLKDVRKEYKVEE